MHLNLPTAKKQENQAPGNLYVVGTPIGNREDITLRAIKILEDVDIVAAEDTRHTGRLLSFYNIKSHLISYHEHNEKKRSSILINRLKSGLSIALASNAGTPCISDPGYSLIREAVANKIRVIPIPGPSAAISALSVSGLPTDRFVFIGFLSKKREKLARQLKALASQLSTMIFYESPKRIINLLNEIIDVMGDRDCLLAREMTKQHEEFLWGTGAEIIETLSKRPVIKGECTLIVKGCEKHSSLSAESLKKQITERLETQDQSLSDIVGIIAKESGVSKNKVYKEAIKIKRSGGAWSRG